MQKCKNAKKTPKPQNPSDLLGKLEAKVITEREKWTVKRVLERKWSRLIELGEFHGGILERSLHVTRHPLSQVTSTDTHLLTELLDAEAFHCYALLGNLLHPPLLGCHSGTLLLDLPFDLDGFTPQEISRGCFLSLASAGTIDLSIKPTVRRGVTRKATDTTMKLLHAFQDFPNGLDHGLIIVNRDELLELRSLL